MTRRQALLLPLAARVARAAPAQWRSEEVRRFPAAEATQGVAVDAGHVYAIANYTIGKYEKKTGKRVSGWDGEKGKPFIHLDSGAVHGGVLYCAHSNYPGVPMVSSIETWDAKTLQHTGSHSFGIGAGSATWVDLYKGHRYVTFAHYKSSADEPGRDPRWTSLLQFDSEWRRLQGWVYPDELVSKLGNFSISGGVFAPDGKLFCTGHDNAEVYVLQFPKGGSSLQWEAMFPVTFNGQGIALDPTDSQLLYGIDRAKREVVVTRIRTS
jgi:hypothetical protein